MKIILIRHGASAGDSFACPKPPVKNFLTATGVQQAERLREVLNKIEIGAAFSSPYGRALQTAEIVLAGKNIEIATFDFLKEWDVNPAFKEFPSAEFDAIMNSYQTSDIEETWKTDLGEGTFELYARICPPFLAELKKLGIHAGGGGFHIEERAEDLNLAVFAHGGSLAILLSFILETRPFPLSRFAFQLTGPAIIDFIKHKETYYPQLLINNVNFFRS
ncbi:MAG: histidine phosphatase family protein [Victivallaceae bacterium]|jgi:broad specificity phosphatase PhoE